MSILLFANNAKTTIASPITSVSTSVNLAPTTGSLFPSPSAGQYFVMTFNDAATGLIAEIVWVTARSGDTLTIVRGQEGTAAKAWLAGDYASSFPTAGTMSDLVQIDQVQDGTYTNATSAGTANALTASIYSNLTSIPNNFNFVINATANNSSTATLQLTFVSPITGATTILSAAPIVKGANLSISPNDIVAGYPCLLTYSSSFAAYVLQNPATNSSAQAPSGAVLHFAMQTAPFGWLIANGAAVSRTTYASLFAAIGTTFGNGDGFTTFNLPNLLGQFIRGWDDGAGIDPGRTFGSNQSSAFGSHNHGVTDPGHSHFTTGDMINPAAGTGVYEWPGGSQGVITNTNPAFTNITIQNSGSTETRPINVALLPCIKT